MTTRRAARSLVVVIFDTLRRDVLNPGFPSFDRLARRTRPLERFVCGSFPTVPMRTDLLTGKLAFLHARWATPAPEDEVLTYRLRAAGIRPLLVTDNYVTVTPQLGADFAPFFEETHVVHGNGSDPYMPADTTAVAPASRPSRSPDFDRQYLTNVATWGGSSPTNRLFARAAETLDRLDAEEPFFLWVDSFAPHEPWIRPSDDIDDDEPFWPPYGDVTCLSPDQLDRMRRRYAERIGTLDTAMTPFVNVLEERMAGGDVALALLSDHGFYLGELGLIGKPKTAPVLPPLFDLVGRLSPHFDGLLTHTETLQPHELTGVIARLLGAEWETPAVRGATRLIGRNSETSRTLTLLTDDAIGIAFHDSVDRDPEWVSREALRVEDAWDRQFVPLGRSLDLPPEYLTTPRLAGFSSLWPA